MTTNAVKRVIASVGVMGFSLASFGCADHGNGGAGDASGDLPEGTIKIVVPFAAGGSLDTNARILAECLGDETEANWIVENREGGGGTTGVSYVLNADPDGRTLAYVSSSGMALTPLQVEDVDYDMEDLTPVATVTEAPAALVVSEDSSFESAEDLFEAAEAGEVSVATTGAHGIYQLVAEELSEEITGINPVPFEGAAPAVSAALGNNADAVLVEISDLVLEHEASDRMRVLATGAETDLAYLPDAATFGELGYDLPQSSNYGLFAASADLDDDTRTVLSEAISSCAANPDVIERIGEEFVLPEPLDADQTWELLEEARDEYTAALD